MSLRQHVQGFRRASPLTFALMASLVAAYVVSIAVLLTSPSVALGFFDNLWLRHAEVLQGKVWLLVTYAWLHSLGETGADTLISLVICTVAVIVFASLIVSRRGDRERLIWIVVGAMVVFMLLGRTPYGAATHLVMNLLGLYFFAPMFEKRWHGRQFVTFFVLCAAGGGVMSMLGWLVAPTLVGDVVIGASGAVMGFIAAFSVYHAEEYVLMPIPIKGKYVVVVLLAFELIAGPGGGNVSFLAHLGGAAAGYLLCTGYWRPGKLMALMGGGTKKRKSHLRLVKTDRDDPPRYLN